MKYRSRTELVAHILEAARGGMTKTKIMYKAFVSHAQLNQYLSILAENGLVEYDKAENKYKTTNKGQKFLQLYNRISQLETISQEISELPRI